MTPRSDGEPPEFCYAGPTVRALVSSLLLVIACGNGDGPGTATPDAYDEGDAYVLPSICWPEAATTPHGSLVLGLPKPPFEDLPTEIPLVWGLQDGFMFLVQVKMKGIAPGDPANLDVRNPHTRVRAFFDDTDVPLNRYGSCSYRVGYVESSDDSYVAAAPPTGSAQDVPVVFETCWRSDRLIGQRIRLEAEIRDASGELYASDTRVVTALEPEAPYIIDHDSPACPEGAIRECPCSAP
jgi:hypothetical protein